jgi:transcription termination/antitermination protein NusG
MRLVVQPPGGSVMSMQSVAAAPWFAVQVWAGREPFSATHLRLRGCEVFLPSRREHRRWSDRVKRVECALFPGYVFCHVAADAAWQLVRSPGVIRVVGDGRHPLPVPTEQVQAIQAIVEWRLAAEPWEFLQAGQRVRIEQGPLRGTEGIVVTAKGRHRLVVSIPLLQRAVAVELNAEWVSVPLDTELTPIHHSPFKMRPASAV